MGILLLIVYEGAIGTRTIVGLQIQCMLEALKCSINIVECHACLHPNTLLLQAKFEDDKREIGNNIPSTNMTKTTNHIVPRLASTPSVPKIICFGKSN
jgi:hypothetical protein